MCDLMLRVKEYSAKAQILKATPIEDGNNWWQQDSSTIKYVALRGKVTNFSHLQEKVKLEGIWLNLWKYFWR